MNARNENSTPMRRFEHRWDFSTLVSRSGPGVTDADCLDHPMRHLAAYIYDGSAVHFPAYELKEILSAAAGEFRGDGPPQSGIVDPHQNEIVQPPRKKARRSMNKNAHSVLRFVERIMDRRYSDERPKCENGDDDFLGDELKSYFGTRDLLFRAEEEILCLAFETALNAIAQCGEAAEIGPQNSSETQADSNGQDSPKYCADPSGGRPPKTPERSSEGPSGGIVGGTLCDGAMKTAFRIIGSVVFVDKRERATRKRMQRTMNMSKELSSNANVTNRRRKYEHLLPPSEKQHGNGGIRGMPREASTEVKSIMEEKYPKQWEWVQQLMTKYELKQERTNDSQQSHLSNPFPDKDNEGSATDGKLLNSPSHSADDKEKGPESNFMVVRRRVLTMDDISLSSGESDGETNRESGASNAGKRERDQVDENRSVEPPTNKTPSRPPSGTAPLSPSTKPPSPYDKLDREAYEMRFALLDMPPRESSSTEVVRHTVDEIRNLLSRYGEVDGAGGISRCGDIFGGVIAITNAKPEAGNANKRFPLSDAMVSSLAKAFLNDAMGSLRAKAFLRSFVLPLMAKMHPAARAVAPGRDAGDEKAAKNQGRPASRALTSLLASLARDRPAECVASVVVPSLVSKKHVPSAPSSAEASFEPTRFQCELVSRVLRGRNALSVPAIALLVEEVLPTGGAGGASSRGGMKWTENTMPVLTACLNRQPRLPDDVVARLADEISCRLSSASPPSMSKSMKISTLFHALVTKYGPQVKSTDRVESLKDSAARLKTFMSKTIGLSLKKLS